MTPPATMLCFGCRCAKRLVSGTKHTRRIIAPDPVQGIDDPASFIHTLPSSFPPAWFCSCLLTTSLLLPASDSARLQLAGRQCRRCPAVSPQMPPPTAWLRPSCLAVHSTLQASVYCGSVWRAVRCAEPSPRRGPVVQSWMVG